MSPPLDLRTSPVIRRTKNLDTDNSCPTIDTVNTPINTNCHSTQIIQESTKQNTENIFHQTSSVNIQISLHQSSSITSSGGGGGSKKLSASSASNSNYHLDTVYETCRLIEEQQTTEKLLQTPKITGALKRNPSERNILCELIEQQSPTDSTSTNSNKNDEDDDDNDVWYTPNVNQKNVRPTKTKSFGDLQPYIYQHQNRCNSKFERKLSLHEIYRTNEMNINDSTTIKEPVKCNENNDGGKLWSLVSSVIRFVKTGSATKPLTQPIEVPRKISPLVKRWASFAGTYFMRVKCLSIIL